MRLNKFLAACNLGSRRSVEKLIYEGKIKVNGKICKEPGKQIDINKDEVFFNNEKLQLPNKNIYIMLNKPVHYLVTTKDSFGRKTVYDLLPDFGLHLFPIGRLDYNSEGLLLFTTDGEFANNIIHPRYKLEKSYKVKVKGYINESQLKMLRNGVKIDGKMTLPAKVFVKKRTKEETILRMIITEGRKRQIRKMIKTVGSEVLSLKRLQIGDVKLGKLPNGMWRFLLPSEVESLKRLSKKISKRIE